MGKHTKWQTETLKSDIYFTHGVSDAIISVDKALEPEGFDRLYVSSLAKRHERPDHWLYVADFPSDRTVVMVYPTDGFGPDMVSRWEPYVDKYGFNQHNEVILDGTDN